jgi:hypothetical protein
MRVNAVAFICLWFLFAFKFNEINDLLGSQQLERYRPARTCNKP